MRIPLCEMRGAAFSHPRRSSVAGVDLRVDAGEIVAVAGPVGAGKSLTLRGAIGLDMPTAGEVRLFDQSIADLDHDRLMLLWRRVAFASLSASILSNLTVQQNLVVPLIMRGMPRSQALSRAGQVLERLELTDTAALFAHQFTLRTLCRVNVARALALDAELYLLDEPSRGLDDAHFALLAGLVRERVAAGAGALVSAGGSGRWNRVADRVVTLELAAANA